MKKLVFFCLVMLLFFSSHGFSGDGAGGLNLWCVQLKDDKLNYLVCSENHPVTFLVQPGLDGKKEVRCEVRSGSGVIQCDGHQMLKISPEEKKVRLDVN